MQWPEVFAAFKETEADYVAFESYNSALGDFGWRRGMFQNVCPDGDAFVRDGLAFINPILASAGARTPAPAPQNLLRRTRIAVQSKSSSQQSPSI